MLQYNETLQRNRLSLNGQWQFWKDPADTLTVQSLNGLDALFVSVPAPWQSQSPALLNFTGTAWYRTSFDIQPAGSQLRTILGFDAVDYQAEVWINDKRIGDHEGGYLPFEFDVTEVIHPGTNNLTVRVSDPAETFPEVPHGKQSWYGMLSGIWQPVWLETRPEKHIQNIRVTPTGDLVNIEVEINQPLDSDQTLVYEIYDPNGELMTRASVSSTQVQMVVEKPELWDIDTPNLYTLQVSLCKPGNETLTTDRRSDTFGFRTVSTENGKIVLNGRTIYLRGALDQDYYPDLISTAPSMEYILDEFRKAKEMGLNCLRVHIKIADPRYYYAADQVGLLLWSELPSCGYLSDDAACRLKQTAEGMIRRDWNHPSIIIWTVINEAWGTELHTNPDHRQWLAETYEWVKTIDPYRLVVDNSPCFPNFHVRSDIDDFHFYAAIPDNRQKWELWVKAFANRAAWIYTQDHQAESLPTADHPALIPNAQDENCTLPPLLVSEFGNWGLPDVQPLLDHYHGEPWWFETGWDWGNGIVYPHNSLQRFYDLHLDRVFGDYAGLARASQWSQFDAMKYEIESMRKHDSIGGYVVTEFTDLHWECNGLLDMLRNPKAYHNRLREINADTVILPSVEKHAFWSGEEIEVELAVSHYGKEPLTGVRINWSLIEEGGDQALMDGVVSGIYAEPASLAQIPSIRVNLPDNLTAARFKIRFMLLDAWGECLTQNEIYLAVFPREKDSCTAAVPDSDLARHLQNSGCLEVVNSRRDVPLITDHLDADLLRRIQQGEKVLFLAETPAGLKTEVPGLELKTRKLSPWEGDWVGTFSWMRRDLFNPAIPGDGHFDMTYMNVVPETVIASTKTNDFFSGVFVGLFTGWLRKPVGLVQRFRIGRGQLVVSTLKLRDQFGVDPVATVMIRELVRELSR